MPNALVKYHAHIKGERKAFVEIPKRPTNLLSMHGVIRKVKVRYKFL